MPMWAIVLTPRLKGSYIGIGGLLSGLLKGTLGV